MKVRSEETKRSVVFLVRGKTDDGTSCEVVLTVSAQCQTKGSKASVENVFRWAREAVEDIDALVAFED